MRFAQLTRSLGMQGIIGAELTLKGGYHLTLLAKDRHGLPQPVPSAHRRTSVPANAMNRNLPPALLPEHAAGLICLSGCPQGELAQLIARATFGGSAKSYQTISEWFGPENYYLELQQNLVFGEYRTQ